MSKETNTEIDLLLRRMGRRDSGDTRNPAAAGGDRHLDADELSSYAQNALPSSARARYTEHLADCATCRRLVTELSLSLGAATAPVEAAHEPSGLKKFLAGLLSPLVLRYAVPALGVIVVMVVGFVVLRQQRQQEFVAQLQEAKPSAPVALPSSEASEGFVNKQEAVADKAKIENSNAKPTETPRKTAAASDVQSGAASVVAPVELPKEERSVAELKPGVASTPAPAPAKAAETVEVQPPKTEDAAKKQEEQPKAKAADEAAKEPAAPTTRGLYQVSPAAQNQNAPATSSPNTARLAGSAAVARSRNPKRADEEKRDDTDRVESKDANIETRTIAGRHFRKQGGIWTDTAYDSSTATVNMARNSEQFRALVADEPAIGTIARQLDGEVVVVWKGHAYHIR